MGKIYGTGKVNLQFDLINLPETEKYGLMTQMRRLAISIPSNIAEGAGWKY